MHGMHHGGMSAGVAIWMGLWGLISLAILVLLILLIIRLIHSLRAMNGRSQTQLSSSEHGQLQSPDEALDVLRRRYAAGEIDEEEYQRRRDGLRS